MGAGLFAEINVSRHIEFSLGREGIVWYTIDRTNEAGGFFESVVGKDTGGLGFGFADHFDRVHFGASSRNLFRKRGIAQLYPWSGTAGVGDRLVQFRGGHCHDPHGNPCGCGLVPSEEAGASPWGLLCAGDADHCGRAGSAGSGQSGQLRYERQAPCVCGGLRGRFFPALCGSSHCLQETAFQSADAVLYAPLCIGTASGGQ